MVKHNFKRIVAMIMVIAICISVFAINTSALRAPQYGDRLIWVNDICPFVDVPKKSWYGPFIEEANRNGLMFGTDSTHFSPNAYVTRGQFIVTLARYANNNTHNISVFDNETSLFKDIKDDYTNISAKWACEYGIMNGIARNTFGPDMPITREQAVTSLYRYYKTCGAIRGTGTQWWSNVNLWVIFSDSKNVSEWARDAISWACANNIISGDGNGHINPKSYLTRAQLAKICLDMVNYERPKWYTGPGVAICILH